ncbi:Methyl farnesoate epoxidase-like 1 [Homarus americanus]|uniref:Methyl farnesoate epoxidase-like 1 n=2 Tax=Homarus americanus TaxID=6706 RepID=A0A8J5N9W9_HOMAM|nr:Methyl farnesoate epoxidase-like 1 [Homarus americanus]
MWRLSCTYGPVVGVYFGPQATVIVNGWEAVKESLNNEDLNGRPFNLYLHLAYNGVKGMMYVEEDLWKEQRRFTLHQFRNLGFSKRSHENIIQEEARELIQEMQDADGSVSLQELLGVSLVNILWAVMGGTRFGRKDEHLLDLVNKVHKMFRAGELGGGLVNALPFLLHVWPRDSNFYTVVDARRLVLDFVRKAVEEHKATLDPDNPRDFIDIYINEIYKNQHNPDISFTEEQLSALCTDVFGAGVETGSSTVSFAVLLTILHPHVMHNMQQELDSVLGQDRFPSMDDRNTLVYTEATLMEAFRHSGAAPLTIPHKALRNTTLMGHQIPANTMVMNNLYSVHMDPHYWDDPHLFRPERFINPDGSLRKDERLIPFGKGRRICPGESLARMTSFMLFAALSQRFTFALDPKVPVHNTEGKFGFTLGPPEFKVFAEPRF